MSRTIKKKPVKALDDEVEAEIRIPTPKDQEIEEVKENIVNKAPKPEA